MAGQDPKDATSIQKPEEQFSPVQIDCMKGLSVGLPQVRQRLGNKTGSGETQRHRNLCVSKV